MKTFNNNDLTIIICFLMKMGILLCKFLLIIVLILCRTRNRYA